MTITMAELVKLVNKQKKQLDELQEKIDSAYTNPSLLIGDSYFKMTRANLQAGSVGPTETNFKLVIPSGLIFTDNSPTAGLVAWSACSVVYNGVTYPIVAGSTAYKWAYWVVGNATFSTSATMPTFNDTTFPIAINNSGTHYTLWDNVLAPLVIEAALIGDAQITNAKIASLDAGKITTGELVGRIIRTAASGARTEMHGADATTGLAVYKANSQLGMTILGGDYPTISFYSIDNHGMEACATISVYASGSLNLSGDVLINDWSLPRSQWGTVSMGSVAAGANAAVQVNFPSTFPSTPVGFGTSAQGDVAVSVYDETTAHMHVYVRNNYSETLTVSVKWFACCS